MTEVLIGFLGGLLIGATGAGVGLLITPLLILTGYRPTVAIATGFGVLVTSKFFGALAHQRLGHWPGRTLWLFVTGGVAGVFLSGWATAVWFTSSPQMDVWLARLQGIALLAMALALLKNGNGETRQIFDAEKRPAAMIAVGMTLAVPITLTSMGSGSLLVPALALVTNWGVPQLAAASNVFGWVVGALSIVLYGRLGQFDWALFAKVLVGLMPGLFAGAVISRRIARRWFVLALGLTGLYLGVRLLLR